MTKMPTSADEGPDEKITPLIESAILELVSLCVKLVSTPIAVLFNTLDYRKQLVALRADEYNTRYSPTVARPLSFYVLWIAVHYFLANVYWRSFSLDQSSLGNLADQIHSQIGPANPMGIPAAAEILKDNNWIIIAFAVTLIIAVKSLLVTLIGWTIGCPIRFRTVLFGSAYTIGTLISVQYAIILAHYAVNALGNFTQAGRIGYFALVYGALLTAIVLVVRINQLIRAVDGTAEIPTFVSWFAGTALWLYLIVLATDALLGTKFTFISFAENVINVFIPGFFPNVSVN